MKRLDPRTPFNSLMAPETFFRLLFTTTFVGLAASAPSIAMAQGTFDLPLINTVGCAIIKWMSGPLAIIIFLLVTVATFVVGIFAKMDWSKILSIVVIYGLLQGLVSGALGLGVITPPPGCLGT